MSGNDYGVRQPLLAPRMHAACLGGPAPPEPPQRFSQLLALPPASEHGELLVEVVRAEGIARSDYRVGDIAGSILGLRKLQPYVCVRAPAEGLGASGLSSPCRAGESWRTRTAHADAEGCADFHERGAFPLQSSSWGAWLFGVRFRVQVYDQRGVQALLRGNPLIGEGLLELSEAVLGSSPEQRVPIRSRQGELRGSVTLRAGLRAPSSAVNVLMESRGSSLAKVATALAQVMAQPGSADAVLEARPEVLKMLPATWEEEVKRMWRDWVVRFCRRTSELKGDECDQQAVHHLSRLARSAQEIVAMCVWWDDDAADVQSLTVAWLQRFFAACAGDVELPVGMDEARFRRLLRAHGSAEGDPRIGLRELGARELPESLPEEAVLAVWLRVLEAKAGEEEEIFTSEPLLTSGRLAPGLAAVLRPPPAGGRPHVFLYHAESIRRWQAQEQADPCTREALQARDILPLS